MLACWRARRPNRRANPATGWFPSTQTALDPGLVRLGRLGGVMATRVQNVQNGQKIVPSFRLPPLCSKGGHNRDAKGCITHAAPASRVHHLHHDTSPASDLNHLHQPCITCINPESPASTLHHAQKAASTLHQPRTGCITRTRELGRPKHQAPGTQVTRNHPYARCPLPHRNGRRGGAQPAPARAQHGAYLIRRPARGITGTT